ncbi:FAD-dependent oxidoreductase [Actinomadura roseirufa]|uniref:FAD-dependent oxidoreductase n=1 Tax=Actinomadura roseirufa TaxID=2094049 RepID=UPI0010418140|nr:FAD-dependent monooxygenase [Actinomadura roseirufa]
MRVIIAGGGIVGLTAAVALGRTGADVVVCEQAGEVRAGGASIGLWRNALDVFDDIGAGDMANDLGTLVSTWFYDPSGRPYRALGSGAADHEFLLLPRARLTESLAGMVGPSSLRLGRKVVGFEEDGDGVTVLFQDGTGERADLLVGADGVHSRVRDGLVPGFPAREHRGHHAWRATVPSGDEPAGGSVLTVGRHRTRGGFARTHGGRVMWMVNQFGCGPLTGTAKEQALARAGHLSDGRWNEALTKLIESTPDEAILHDQIMRVPPLPRWTSGRVVLAGDAAHGLSPHIAAGGTLGVEDVGVLVRALARYPSQGAALKAYEADRLSRFERVREFSDAVEGAGGPEDYARHYAAFSRWMLTGRTAAGLT